MGACGMYFSVKINVCQKKTYAYKIDFIADKLFSFFFSSYRRVKTNAPSLKLPLFTMLFISR